MAVSLPSARESRTRRTPVLALLLAAVPGIGHWAVGRGGRGLVAFMAFAGGLNLLLLSRLLEPVTRLSPAWGWALAGAAVLFSAVDVTRIALQGALERRRMRTK